MGDKKDSFEILLEDIQADVKKVLEATDTHTKQLERLEPMQATLDQVKVDVDAMKATLEQVSLVDLKLELSDLKRRVEGLEAKAK